MKHASAEMIKSVVDNIELVVLTEVIDPEDDNKNYWSVSNLSTLVVASNKFFLCLPQHKEACLHWLNGGDVQDWYRDDWSDCGFYDGTTPWAFDHMFMDDSAKYRIKPKKEKRWIGLSSSSCHTTGHYETKLEAVNVTEEQPWAKAYRPWHFLEIEIEIEV